MQLAMQPGGWEPLSSGCSYDVALHHVGAGQRLSHQDVLADMSCRSFWRKISPPRTRARTTLPGQRRRRELPGQVHDTSTDRQSYISGDAEAVANPLCSCTSETSASVLRIMPATLAAFSSAQRVTLAGSMMPASTRLTYASAMTSKPQLGLLSRRRCSTTTLPSSPALATSWRSGSCSARFRI